MPQTYNNSVRVDESHATGTNAEELFYNDFLAFIHKLNFDPNFIGLKYERNSIEQQVKHVDYWLTMSSVLRTERYAIDVKAIKRAPLSMERIKDPRTVSLLAEPVLPKVMILEWLNNEGLPGWVQTTGWGNMTALQISTWDKGDFWVLATNKELCRYAQEKCIGDFNQPVSNAPKFGEPYRRLSDGNRDSCICFDTEDVINDIRAGELKASLFPCGLWRTVTNDFIGMDRIPIRTGQI